MKDKFWNIKSLNENAGELLLYGEISNAASFGDEITPKEFKSDLDKLGDIKELDIYINSPGGDVFAGQAIYSILKRHKAKKKVYIDGLAASIASVIAMAGDRVYMPQNAMLMLHNPWAFGIGNAKDFRKLADDLEKVKETLVSAYYDHSALLKDEIMDLMDKETWLTADECYEYGFCDVVEKEKEIAALLNKDLLRRYLNTPKRFFRKGKPPDNNLKRKIQLELEL